MNVKFDMPLEACGSIEDELVIQSPKGVRWKVDIVSPYSDWCRRCKQYYHTEECCPRFNQNGEGRRHNGERQGGHKARFRQHLMNQVRPNQEDTAERRETHTDEQAHVQQQVRPSQGQETLGPRGQAEQAQAWYEGSTGQGHEVRCSMPYGMPNLPAQVPELGGPGPSYLAGPGALQPQGPWFQSRGPPGGGHGWEGSQVPRNGQSLMTPWGPKEEWQTGNRGMGGFSGGGTARAAHAASPLQWHDHYQTGGDVNVYQHPSFGELPLQDRPNLVFHPQPRYPMGVYDWRNMPQGKGSASGDPSRWEKGGNFNLNRRTRRTNSRRWDTWKGESRDRREGCTHDCRQQSPDHAEGVREEEAARGRVHSTLHGRTEDIQEELSKTSVTSRSKVRWGSECSEEDRRSAAARPAATTSSLESSAESGRRNLTDRETEGKQRGNKDNRTKALEKNQMETVQRCLIPILCTRANEGTYFLAVSDVGGRPLIPSMEVDKTPTPNTILDTTRKLYGEHVPVRLIPHSSMVNVVCETVQGYSKMYFPLMDARIPEEAVSPLAQSGIRWFPTDLIRERNSAELESIQVLPGISALVLPNVNDNLPREEDLHSAFLNTSLVEEWRSSSRTGSSRCSAQAKSRHTDRSGAGRNSAPASSHGQQQSVSRDYKRKQYKSMDRIRVATWNIQGLGDANGRSKKRRFKSWLHEKRINCVMVQEFKLNDDKLRELALWRAWMKVGIGTEEWVFMTVYSPNEVGERASFFQRLLTQIPKSDKLVLAGDWNVSLDEALRLGSHSADRKDVQALLELSAELALADPFPILNPDDPDYTWFSHMHRDRQVVTSLRRDFFLLSEQVAERITTVRQICSPISDHEPVLAELKLHTGLERGRGFFRLNSQVLEEPGIKRWVETHMAAWVEAKLLFETSAAWLDGGIAITSGILDVCSRILARARNKKEADCRRRVEEAEERMEGHPISAVVWAAEKERRMSEWDSLQAVKQKRWVELLQEKGIETNDTLSKETFQKLQPRRTQQQMIELKHPFDSSPPSAGSATGMLNYARMYYSDILTSRRPQEDLNTDLSQKSDMWNDTEVPLQDGARLDLDRPLTLEEVSQTLKSMAKGKSPGVDGLTVEFYVANWDIFGPLLVELYNEVLVGGRLGRGMTHGVIAVLFKKGYKADVRNWRPISLLNVSYKILAKSLARRLGRYLPGLVERDQGAFVQGRSIFNNIVTAMESLEIVQGENLDTAVLLLDLEKAYDKVGWTFVLTTLRRMGFGNSFCSWIIAMYTYSTSAVMINDHLSESFTLSRSLRQGCPLAPLIFVLQMEVLLNRIQHNPDIRGLQLHTGEECKVKALADDLFAVCENSVTSLSALKSVMCEYSVLSEATVNWSKSAYLLPSQFVLQFVTSVKELAEGIVKAIRRLISRFLWKPRAQNGEGFISKVALETLSFPREKDGLGLIDPARKKQAQLRCWIVKVAMAHSREHWVTLAERILGGEWGLSRPQDVWACFFMPSFRKKRLKSAFWEPVRKAWNKSPADMPHTPTTKEEVLCQLLFENPAILDQTGVPLAADGSAGSFGQAWVKRGVVRIEDIWCSGLGSWKTLGEVKLALRGLQRVEQHRQQVIAAIPQRWLELLGPEGVDPPGTWYKSGTEGDDITWKVLEILPSAFRRVERWRCVDYSNSLSLVDETTVRTWDNPPQVRVIGGRSESSIVHTQSWVGRAPLRQLPIDPQAWSWSPGVTESPPVRLLEYSTARGYQLAAKVMKTPALIATQRWQAICHEDMSGEAANFERLWKSLTDLPNDKQVSILWLLSLLSTPSAVLLRGRGMEVDLGCSRCRWPFESAHHLWWDCPASKRIWNWWSHHWRELGGTGVTWDEKWVLLGFLPSEVGASRGWGYMAQATRGLICEVIWADRNRARFQKRPLSDLEIKTHIKRGLRQAIRVNWRRKAKAGQGNHRQLRWFMRTWAKNFKLAAVHRDRGLVLSPWSSDREETKLQE
ncbi:hypothetical protein CBR_g50932 [Chara braunii]|uniref:Reverse transcriptase domain-containing protein n=1 Tax=Chara braunii TaxID=69332 RepID=A0A388M7Z0_CHABU|nr:hypothetical protein CBR_g50932 [Chara braunii]|eukprot:GBG90589.1 hypothetical protein CBR_g50932 [Chara braunii]